MFYLIKINKETQRNAIAQMMMMMVMIMTVIIIILHVVTFCGNMKAKQM